jgi:Leucine-rich repeat (LRR) protein
MSTPSKIKILQNLGNYQNLNSFSIQNHDISNIKTRLNPNLSRLNCSFNNVNVTNFSQNTNLTHLTCTFNLLTALDLTSNVSLVYLDCSYNGLSTLDLSNNVDLEYLNISNNELLSLDTTSNSELLELNCSVNRLTGELDLSSNNNLSILNCSYNNIETLDLNNTPNLTQLYCTNNVITELDFTSIESLEVIECGSNDLVSINLSNHNLNLERFDCSDSRLLTTITLGTKPYLKYINCSDCIYLNNFDLTSCLFLEELYAVNGSVGNSLNLNANVELKILGVSNSNLTSLTLTGLINLEQLNVSANGLTSIDLSDSEKIYDLDVSNNNLTSITLPTSLTSTSTEFIFKFNNNDFDTSAINSILQTLDGYTMVEGSTYTIYITGGNNEAPSGAGTTSLNSLIAKGWNVDVDTPYPVILSFSPGSGLVGSSVTIIGQYFVSVSSVKFNNVSATFTVNSSTQITATVPVGATTGPIKVITATGEVESVSEYYVTMLTPVITSFTPIAGLVGSTVIITGNYFVDLTDVNFNGITATYTVNSVTQITATVPAGTTTGPITITTDLGTVTSDTDYTPVLAPSISSFTPSSAFANTAVQITGSEFTFVSSVAFNNKTASYTVVTSQGIKATIPSIATTGFITVTTAGGTATTDPSVFTVIIPSPTITSFNPNSGATGTYVTITGTNLLNTSRVSFNNIASAYYTVSSSTQVVAAVPVGFTTTGKVALKTPGGSVTSSADFTYAVPTERLEYIPNTSNLNWYTAENYGGTSHTNVSLNYFQLNVTPTDVYTLEFLDDANITDIENLSTYSNLKTLDVTFQNLTSLNLTGNGSITQLYCDNNDFTSLDLSNNPVITVLSCNNNIMSSLNVANMTSLENLSCIGCALPSLSLTTNTALKYLQANNNQLGSLNLNNNTGLLTANISQNLLSSITLTNNTGLTSLNIGVNSLSSLDVSSNTALTYLNCESNNLSTLSLTSLTNLQELHFANNTLTSLDLSNNTNLTQIFGGVNNITTVTMPTSVNVTTTYHFDLSDNALTQATINNILQKIDSYPTPTGNNLTDKLVILTGGTNATPSGAGLTAKTSLESKGYYVQTN